ncbi:type II secretion system protein J [Paenibacillus sp. S150]|uniref:PulJ/GspJ family protein n=1 Tax=Paenibacillus sp. S150 TaxID=2749826 RepID=UPI001C5839D7|nr:prepilin-type N-terminal cleavage/methylation domain-containing protein [Paenibacillus sp. S150]MBW4081637.1 prepilin-type N-terminal cleavage/methylation domain-containing protein [Paenibacillus sp. S150]
MKKFVNSLRSEKGVTLIELVVAITLFTTVAGLIYGVMMFGIRSYNQITVENRLRDDGDLLMSAIITEIYTFAPDMISSDSGLDSDGNNWSLITLRHSGSGADDKDIVIREGALYIVPSGSVTGEQDSRISIDAELSPTSNIILNCNDVGTCESGLININLNLLKLYGGKDYTLNLESTFGF